MDDSVIKCDEIWESYEEQTKAIPANLNKKNITSKYKFSIFYFYLFLWINFAFLIAVSSYCYLIKKSSKRKSFIAISRHK